MKFINLILFVIATLCITSCGSDDEPTSAINNSSVIINENGTTSTGAPFSAIDNETFRLNYIKYKVTDSHLEIIGSDSYELQGEVRPYATVTYKGSVYSTTSIATGAFCFCNKITSIVLPSTVEYIGKAAFLDCENMNTVILPDKLTTIQRAAFLECISLKSINIPNSVNNIDEGAFAGCISIKSIDIPSGVISIKPGLFARCTSLTDLHLPYDFKALYISAFLNCAITSIVIPPSVTYLNFSISREEVVSTSKYNLKDIYTSCKATPTYVSDEDTTLNLFEATLHVPASDVEWYKSQPGWSKFTNIVGDYNP